ncbi:type II toxin-antitoxin system RelE/ParE family toxin [Frankia sp. AgB32]|uniref:type II toxin-antitoxin system RelE/ParE family toxin n=1 Tax=Frankia sp. AgB32 TaxID=631119 RepID=UPI00200BCA9B|nr:type II toxin-antitoxin system RelE/ParE family toxin [Frankia sp. AgB32]MCK9894428.1 type II toxin-antitoxin system RelE/ParE family toxin [Frankia sp. AgB32]
MPEKHDRHNSGSYWAHVEVVLHPEVEQWFLDLCRTDSITADLVAEAIDVLAENGPGPGRPLVDRLKGSTYHHMKELRPGSTGTSEIRMIFAFDPHREAVFLIAGDKSGAWRSWYQTAVPLADERFSEHLSSLKAQEGS